MKANLCKCNNCDSILINMNSQINAKKYKLNGNELDMQWTGGMIEYKNNIPKWVCPTCMTDDHLIDL